MYNYILIKIYLVYIKIMQQAKHFVVYGQLVK